MAEKQSKVKITAAKGRPMLSWVGKKPPSYVTPFPAQHVETFAPKPETGNLPARRSPEGGGGNPELWKDWPDQYPTTFRANTNSLPRKARSLSR